MQIYAMCELNVRAQTKTGIIIKLATLSTFALAQGEFTRHSDFNLAITIRN